VYSRSRQEVNKNGGLLPTKKNPTKVMVYVVLAFNGECKIVALPADESFYVNFHVKYLPLFLIRAEEN